VILFQCLSGTVPFHSDNPAKIMVMHILEPVPSLLSRKPDLPPALEGVVEKAMAKNPDDRYGTTTELASAFEAAVSTEAIALPLPIVNGAEVTPQGARPPDTLIFAPTGALPQPTLATTATPLPSVQPAERRKIIPVIWAAVGVILLIFLAFLLGGNMFSSRPTPTPTLDLTEVFLVEQASYTPTPPPRPPSPILGGADKAAILIDSEIWQMNLDGSQLDQITTDGEEKTNPHWSIDGQAILYIAGKCLKSVNIYTGLVERIFCLEDIDTFNSFDISPDGKQMALSLNQAALYIIDNDYERLRQTTASSELSSLASCPNFAPIRSDIRQPRLVRWSDDQGLAVLHSEIWQGKPSDAIRVLDIGDCVEQPSSLFSLSPKLFLFTLRGYYDNQTIPSFDWNGQAQFVLNSLIQNIGYGDLNTYNMVENTMQQLNPIQKSCCYQNAQWSPDQRYLFFTHQPETSKDIFLYYVTTQAAAAGVELPPLSVSEGVFFNTTGLLQVDLRPSK